MNIEIANVTKSFGLVRAVDSIALSVGNGITGLIGENGAGKSTLLRLIAGVYSPDAGSINIDGIPSERQKAEAKIFFLPDDPFAPRGANIKSLLKFYGMFYEIDEKKVSLLLSKLNLPSDRKIRTFSKGMKRQAFLVMAMSVKTEALLIDEGFDGLDPLIMSIIKEELLALASEGKTILVSSHNLETLSSLADQFVLLSHGKLGKSGEEKDYSLSIAKYQAHFNSECSRDLLEKFGFNILFYREIGSVVTFVILRDDNRIEELRKAYNPAFLEPIPATSEEIFAARMILEKQGGIQND